ncbi:MAG: hypothetical protein NWE98_09370 [Candidatus Bathyarchaeota archaeon]|nr:hypothetical protein [Candidatus Bathyarchaeota archaeon]
MKEAKGTFNVLASVEKHIESLKPLLPKQAIVCIGEYTIKNLLKAPGVDKHSPLPILIEKSSDEIYKWMPKGFNPYYVLDFDDVKNEMHFWYDVLPYVSKDNSVIESLKKKSLEKLHGAIIYSSVWDGIGSASLPTFISKFRTSRINSLAISILPSKLQPIDTHFNAYAALQMCQTIEGAIVLLLDKDHLERYQGVNRQGAPIKGADAANYLVNLFLSKETLVDEVAEIAKTFNIKLFTPLLVTGASHKIYGSLENMLDTALLKPFFDFDLSTASLLYVLLRIPPTLKDKLPRDKIENAIVNWFSGKATLKSIYITEPVYTEDMNDRVDIALLIGGFDTAKLFADMEKKTASLKSKAIDRGAMVQDGQIVFTPEPIEPEAKTPKDAEITQKPEETKDETPKTEETLSSAEITTPTEEAPSVSEQTSTIPPADNVAIIAEEAEATAEQVSENTSAIPAQTGTEPSAASLEKMEEPKEQAKPRRARRTRKKTS